MSESQHMREQAQRCFRLARDVMDREVRTRLEELGREFERKAQELEHDSGEDPRRE